MWIIGPDGWPVYFVNVDHRPFITVSKESRLCQTSGKASLFRNP